MRRKRLFWRLFALLLAANAAAILLAGLYSERQVRLWFWQQVRDTLELQATEMARLVTPLFATRQTDRLQEFCRTAGAGPTRITAIFPSGLVAGDSREEPRNMDNHADRPEIRAAFAGAIGQCTRLSPTVRESMVYVAAPVRQGEQVIGVMRAAVSLVGEQRALDAVRRNLLWVGMAGCLLVAAVSLIVSRWISRPLEAVRAGAERFARGELLHRLPPSSVEEIAAVADALNSMARQLQERIETIQRQQYEHEAMLMSMKEGVLAVDLQAAIISLNGAGAELLEVDAHKAAGRLLHETIRRAELLRFVDATLASEESLEADLELSGAVRRLVRVQGTSLYGAQRRKIGALLVMHDVTRLRQLEQMRSEFVANVSHELRTPITSIKGFVETLLDGAWDDRDNAQRFLQIIHRQVDRLDAIIGDLLALSRVERGNEEQRIQFAAEPLHEVLAAAIEMCQAKADDKRIAIRLDCPPDLRAEINASLLEQAVVNLLDNAVKYSEPGGFVEAAACCEEGRLVIRVTDRGCGIEAEHLPRLFERFYRVDKARSRELGGTGLGLAIVKHIALAHRGAVEVQSALGKGSQFTIRLPLASRRADSSTANTANIIG